MVIVRECLNLTLSIILFFTLIQLGWSCFGLIDLIITAFDQNIKCSQTFFIHDRNFADLTLLGNT